MNLTNHVKSPMAASEKLSAYSTNLFENPTLYDSIVGTLQYLSFTHPNSAFAVSKVYQFMRAPRVPHWMVVKCILH